MNAFYFYHVPKCGGNYINKILKETSQSLGGHYVNFTNLSDKKRDEDKDQNIRSFIRKIPSIQSDFVFLHHHHGYPGFGELYSELEGLKLKLESTGGTLHIFTCVRSPLSHAVSQINYLKNRGQVKNLSVEQYLSEERFRNCMYKYILYNHPQRHDDKMDLSGSHFDKTIGLFDRIFTVERMESLEQWLASHLNGHLVLPKEKINVGDHQITLSRTEIDQFLDLNGLDVALYNSIAETS